MLLLKFIAALLYRISGNASRFLMEGYYPRTCFFTESTPEKCYDISTQQSKYDALPKEQQLKLLGEIQEDSEWLIRMVENLLSVTRIDGAKVEVVKTPTVLDELIDSVLMKFSKKHPNQKVITQIPEEFVDIPMDSLLIEQVLLNLLENAVFHAKGMTELTLSVSLVGDKAVFEVADNGCGIPDDALQKIFTGSYEKSAAPVDGTRSNMGIGLSVCAAIVKAHGSEITAENRKGGGQHDNGG